MQIPASNLRPNRLHRLVGNGGTEVDEVLPEPILRSPRPKRVAQKIGQMDSPSSPSRAAAAESLFSPVTSAPARTILGCMRTILLTALLGIFALAASAADVTGKWTAQVPGRSGNTSETTFVFKVDGAKLTGTMDGGRGGPVEITDGKTSGDDVSFVVVRNFGGNDMKMVFKGKVSGSEIKFSRSMEGMPDGPPPIEFTAKKAN